MSVSILTVTQWTRRESLAILNDMIGDQTYRGIVEWIIVEGSQGPEDRERNGAFVRTITNVKCPIRYITPGPLKLGALRAAANEAAIGDYRVVMDDDDYYPPDRISHAVERLARSSKKIAGCSPMLMYDYGSRALYQFKRFASTHSVSSCMAWKRDYAGTYDPDAITGEEAHFTNGFTEPMVQLDPAKTIIQSSHGTNTYSKKALLKTLQEVGLGVTAFIPPVYLDRLCHVFQEA
jgi:hypothetical protein